jgi:hypothetical protein
VLLGAVLLKLKTYAIEGTIAGTIEGTIEGRGWDSVLPYQYYRNVLLVREVLRIRRTCYAKAIWRNGGGREVLHPLLDYIHFVYEKSQYLKNLQKIYISKIPGFYLRLTV